MSMVKREGYNDKPQAYINALRKGEYSVAAGLGPLLNQRYLPLNKDEDNKDQSLGADDVTPLMASLLAETDINFTDIVKIQHGILSTDWEERYCLTQVMSGAAVLLSHEASLQLKEENKGKQAKDIRAIVTNAIQQAIKGPEYTEGNAAQQVAKTTMMELSKEMLASIDEEKTHQRLLDYTISNLKEDKASQLREAGTRLLAFIDKIDIHIGKMNKEFIRLSDEIDALDKIEGGYDPAQRKHMVALKLTRLSEKAEAFILRQAVEAQLVSLIAQPEQFEENNILYFLKAKATYAQISVKQALSGYPVEEPLQEIKQQIESYLEFLEQNPAANQFYRARKHAAENMLILVKTADLRSPQDTLKNLECFAKTIENNRPGFDGKNQESLRSRHWALYQLRTTTTNPIS
ncbi:hypothetical protein DGG96_10720 [Legionella qingyii]|uniref:Uncharacterized protein n=1 Tax=Legionella qingyii TaxID=2184757 RepID=A0A317U2J8_9GAMM|nr:hypothetical protein [Legionella qingyii]PWY55579.1 hypothetical protein DGG96_10720 [Legionella qingyii]RUR21826.1 hypothetical protein ELY20_11450 [Legionella qingyii]RUR25246.1 hypothetical protein ELY16_09900 [Legionella qingyii]